MKKSQHKLRQLKLENSLSQIIAFTGASKLTVASLSKATDPYMLETTRRMIQNFAECVRNWFLYRKSYKCILSVGNLTPAYAFKNAAIDDNLASTLVVMKVKTRIWNINLCVKLVIPFIFTLIQRVKTRKSSSTSFMCRWFINHTKGH